MFKSTLYLLSQFPIAFYGVPIFQVFIGIRIFFLDYVPLKILLVNYHSTFAAHHALVAVVNGDVSSAKRAVPARVADALFNHTITIFITFK